MDSEDETRMVTGMSIVIDKDDKLKVVETPNLTETLKPVKDVLNETPGGMQSMSTPAPDLNIIPEMLHKELLTSKKNEIEMLKK